MQSNRPLSSSHPPTYIRLGEDSHTHRTDDVKPPSRLKIALLNAQSLPAHIDDFRLQFADESFHIIAVTESWLRVFMLDALVSLHGYYMLRHDRTYRPGGGGGICLFIHKSLNSKCIRTSDNLNLHPEFMLVEISPVYSSKILICLVYRPPRVGFLTDITDAFTDVSHQYLDCVIVGDYNADMTRQSGYEIFEKLYRCK